MAISDAVSQDRVAAIVGYENNQADFRETTPNLPIRIGVFAEANDANQTALDIEPWVYDGNIANVAQRYGYGSPIYTIIDQLCPISGGVTPSKIEIYPQAKATGTPTAKAIDITVSGTATKATSITLNISGKNRVRGKIYQVAIAKGDTATTVATKIYSAINSVIGAPVTATNPSTGVARAIAKWSGLTSDAINIEVVSPNNDSAGLSYVITSSTSGTGTPSVAASLDKIGNKWVNVIVSGYGFNATTVMDEFEAWNGFPDQNSPTGRFVATKWKPAVVIVGNTAADTTTATDSRASQCTIASAVAPNEKYEPYMVAAEMARLLESIVSNNPHLDVIYQLYPALLAQKSNGTMSDPDVRDTIAKKGSSTIEKIGDRIQALDFLTTYHPVGDDVPAYRWVRNLIVDWNIRYAVLLLEQEFVIGHVIANDEDTVTVEKVIKPSTWKGILKQAFSDWEARAWIVDSEFSDASLTVGISTVNPDRFETFFRYKRSGVARVVSTTSEAGFNYGKL